MSKGFGTPKVKKTKGEVIAYDIEAGVVYATGEFNLTKGVAKAKGKYPACNFVFCQGSSFKLLKKIVKKFRKTNKIYRVQVVRR